MCRWEKDKEERRIKEEGKREKTALATWRKLLMGLRIIERVTEEYGRDADAHIEEVNPFTNPSKAKKTLRVSNGMGSTPNRGPVSYADDKEITGGGFLVDDEYPNAGVSLTEAFDPVAGAGELIVDDETGPVDGGSLNRFPKLHSDVAKCGPPDNDDKILVPTETDLDDKVIFTKKDVKDGKKVRTTFSISTNSPKRRTAPKRKVARKSETALKSHFQEEKSDEDQNSNQGASTSTAIAVKKSVKRARKSA